VEPIRRLVHITSSGIHAFALLADDHNPIHMDDTAARAAGFQGRICHGGLFTAVISGMIAKAFPGAIWLEHTIQFKRPALVGQTLEFILSLDETIKKPTRTPGIIQAEIKNTAGELVAISRNVVLLPAPMHVEGEPATVQPPVQATAVAKLH
jgi:acyl dehydratase